MRWLLSLSLVVGVVLGMSMPNLPSQAATQLDALATQLKLTPVSATDLVPTLGNHGGDHDGDKDHGGHHRNNSLVSQGGDHDGDKDHGGHHRNNSLVSQGGDHEGDKDHGGHHRVSLGAGGQGLATLLANHDGDKDGDKDHGGHHRSLTAPSPSCSSNHGEGSGGE